MAIQDYKTEIMAEISDMYDQSEGHQSIIFDTDEHLYLSIKSDKIYFFNPNENLYRNVLFKIEINSSVRNLKKNPFFVKNHTPDSLTKKIGADTVTVLEPTGDIVEIEDKPILFENLTHFSSFFINKPLSKQEAYSLLLSESFNDIFNKIVKNPSKHVSLINK